eukprot:m.33831 g.33831  ORF g.33831 m.33831 type:complete len:387 (-) comp5629_c1_seq1:27-1187(-)
MALMLCTRLSSLSTRRSPSTFTQSPFTSAWSTRVALSMASFASSKSTLVPTISVPGCRRFPLSTAPCPPCSSALQSSGFTFSTSIEHRLLLQHFLYASADLAGCRPRLFMTHYLMLALVITKALSLAFHAIDYHFIKVEGTPEEGWAVTYYIISFSKGILLFLTVLLVGAGFGFIKHVLSSREKQLFAVVISLQVFSNITYIILEETAEGSAQRTTWRSLGLLVDLLCCLAILFPVVWSMRHLKEAAGRDGKAEASLQKLRLFRRFYMMVLAYIYTTRIIVYLIESVLPFELTWLGPFLNELVTFFFFVVTGWLYSPLPDNPYLRVPQEDGEMIPMDEIVTGGGNLRSNLRQTASSGRDPEADSEPLIPNETLRRKTKQVPVEDSD